MAEFTGPIEHALPRPGVTEAEVTSILEKRQAAEYPELTDDEFDIEDDAELLGEANTFLIEDLVTVGGDYEATKAALQATWTGGFGADTGELFDPMGNAVAFDDAARTITLLANRTEPIRRIQY